MQSAIFFIPTRIYALFSADSRKIITFYNHFLVDFFRGFLRKRFQPTTKLLVPNPFFLYFLLCDIIKVLDDFAEIMDNLLETS